MAQDFEKEISSSARFQKRLQRCSVVIFLLFAVLFGRLFWLQVTQHEYYQKIAGQENRLALRLHVLARNGRTSVASISRHPSRLHYDPRLRNFLKLHPELLSASWRSHHALHWDDRCQRHMQMNNTVDRPVTSAQGWPAPFLPLRFLIILSETADRSDQDEWRMAAVPMLMI